MPTPKAVGAYPTHLIMVVESVLTSGQPAVLAMDTEKAAMRLRLQVYGLKGALRNNTEHPLSSRAEKLTTFLQGKVLTITHVDFNVPAQVVRAGEL